MLLIHKIASTVCQFRHFFEWAKIRAKDMDAVTALLTIAEFKVYFCGSAVSKVKNNKEIKMVYVRECKLFKKVTHTWMEGFHGIFLARFVYSMVYKTYVLL